MGARADRVTTNSQLPKFGARSLYNSGLWRNVHDLVVTVSPHAVGSRFRMYRRKPRVRSAGARPSAGRIRPAGRSGRQGRRLGADAARARRSDARSGEGHAAGLRDGPRLGRRPQRDCRCQARRRGDGRRIQPEHGAAVEEECRRGGCGRQGDLRRRRHVQGRHLQGVGDGALPPPEQHAGAA